MLNSRLRRTPSLLGRSIAADRYAAAALPNLFAGLLYTALCPTLAAPSALTRPSLVPCGILTHSGRTLSRIAGRAPRLAAYRLERCRGGRRAFRMGGWTQAREARRSAALGVSTVLLGRYAELCTVGTPIARVAWQTAARRLTDHSGSSSTAEGLQCFASGLASLGAFCLRWFVRGKALGGCWVAAGWRPLLSAAKCHLRHLGTP